MFVLKGGSAPDQVGSGTNWTQTQAGGDGIQTKIGHFAGSEMQGNNIMCWNIVYLVVCGGWCCDKLNVDGNKNCDIFCVICVTGTKLMFRSFMFMGRHLAKDNQHQHNLDENICIQGHFDWIWIGSIIIV